MHPIAPALSTSNPVFLMFLIVSGGTNWANCSSPWVRCGLQVLAWILLSFVITSPGSKNHQNLRILELVLSLKLCLRILAFWTIMLISPSVINIGLGWHLRLKKKVFLSSTLLHFLVELQFTILCRDKFFACQNIYVSYLDVVCSKLKILVLMLSSPMLYALGH